MKIFKYPLNNAIEHIYLPKDAEILTVANQYGRPVLWAKVNTDKAPEMRIFITIGTGFDLPNFPLKYVGTTLFENDSLVLHIFEQIQS